MALVAKSYQNYEQIGDIFNENGKQYIKVKSKCDRCGGLGYGQHYSWAVNSNGICYKCNGAGYITDTVRVYSDAEYARMEKASEVKKSKKEVEHDAKVRVQNQAYKEKNGFENGYIMVVLGETYSIKEILKDYGARFSKPFGWYFFGGYEPKDFGYEMVRVDWEEVGMTSSEYTVLKDDQTLKDWFKQYTYKDSPSKYQHEIGQRKELNLRVDSVFSFETKYGTSYLHTMSDSDDNVYIWSTSSRKLDKHKTYRLKGTIKDHKEYNGVKQTVLTRCSVIA